MNMSILLFTKQNCPFCPAAKEVARRAALKLSMEVKEYDIESVEGLAEAMFYSVLSTPSIIIADKDGNEISAWRGKAPNEEEVVHALRSSG